MDKYQLIEALQKLLDIITVSGAENAKRLYLVHSGLTELRNKLEQEESAKTEKAEKE